MKINENMINSEKELINLIKDGINPLEYIQNESDVEFVSKAISHEEQSEDPYWDDMAEILLKAVIHYLIIKNEENKSLKRCLEITNLGVDREKLNQLFNELDDEAIKYMYKPIEIAPDKTYNNIVEILSKKLSNLVK